MKNQIILFLLILPYFVLSQNGDDGWNNRELWEYENDIEVARESLKLKPGFSTAGHSSFRAYINPDLPLNGGVPVTDGEFNMNYIRTFMPIHDNATPNEPEHNGLDYSLWAESIVYFDGLGRELQQRKTKKTIPALCHNPGWGQWPRRLSLRSF